MPAETTTADLLLQAQYAAAALDLAKMAIGTAFIPDSLKVWKDPEKAKGDDADKSLANTDLDATANQVALAIVKGTGLGFRWTEALEAVVVINNRPFLTALALRALIQRTPYLRMEITETTSTRAIVTGWRQDENGDWGAPQVSMWDMERVRRAKFRGFANPNGMWAKMPGNMLLARATADDSRYIGADVVLGIPYIAEEADSWGDYDAENPNGSGPPPAPPGTPALTSGAAAERTARRSSRRRPAPPPAGSGGDTPDPGGKGEPMSVDDQRTEIQTGLAKLGITRPAEQRSTVNGWLDLDGDARVQRMTDLTLAQARDVLKRIDAELRAKAQDASEGNGQGRAEDGGEPPAGGEPGPDAPEGDAK